MGEIMTKPYKTNGSEGRSPYFPSHCQVESGVVTIFGWWFGTWLLLFHNILGTIIPTDELIFFRGFKPPTRYCLPLVVERFSDDAVLSSDFIPKQVDVRHDNGKYLYKYTYKPINAYSLQLLELFDWPHGVREVVSLGTLISSVSLHWSDVSDWR